MVLTKPTENDKNPRQRVPHLAQTAHQANSSSAVRRDLALEKAATSRRTPSPSHRKGKPHPWLELVAIGLALISIALGALGIFNEESGSTAHSSSEGAAHHPTARAQPKTHDVHTTHEATSTIGVTATSAYSIGCHLPQAATISVRIAPPDPAESLPSAVRAGFSKPTMFTYRTSAGHYVAGCYGDIQVGTQNDSNRILQQALLAKGIAIPSGATGFYGAQTSFAYRSHISKLAQRSHGSVPTAQALESLGIVPAVKIAVLRVVSPVPGAPVSLRYGYRDKRYPLGYHTGVDYVAPPGTVAQAVLPGRIEWANKDGRSFGTWVGLRATNGRLYVYAHLSRLAVGIGDSVEAGQQIGNVGATGGTTGPHLHLEDHPAGPFVYGMDRLPQW
ncbi:M23 family metallopeptidase [Streptomyces sp. 900105245]